MMGSGRFSGQPTAASTKIFFYVRGDREPEDCGSALSG
jgi:hypothetical protein